MLGFLLVSFFTPAAQACSCIQTDLIHSYRTNDVAVLVKVTSERQAGMDLHYNVRVLEDYKSDRVRGTKIRVDTSSSSASCGNPLTVGEKYYLVGWLNGTTGNGREILSIVSCGYNRMKSQLTHDELDFLDNRYNQDKASCNDGTQPVACFADPCSVDSCSTTNATCESNYCGGCTAEWYKNDFATCTPW